MLPALDKAAVAKSFSRAAASYDAVAELQRDVGDKLLAKVPVGRYPNVLDLGCGTGYFTARLAQHTGAEMIAGLDIAEGMIAHCRSRATPANALWYRGDAEQLPFESASLDLIFANLVLQWCPNLDEVFREAARVLRPGGRLLFSTFGPDSLRELRMAWSKVDSYVHVNSFKTLADIEQDVNGSDLRLGSDIERITRYYPQLQDLTHELKALGAHNVNSGRPGGLTGRFAIRQLKAVYETLRSTPDGLPATYEIYYLSLEKRQP